MLRRVWNDLGGVFLSAEGGLGTCWGGGGVHFANAFASEELKLMSMRPSSGDF